MNKDHADHERSVSIRFETIFHSLSIMPPVVDQEICVGGLSLFATSFLFSMIVRTDES